MKYEFSDSFSFNQMLLVSVFVHLFAMTLIMFLPKSKLPPPLITQIFMVDFVDMFAGNFEKTEAKSDSQKIMPAIAVKNEAASEKKFAQPLPVAKKEIVPPKKTQPPVKGTPKEKVADIPKPKQLTLKPKELPKPVPLPKPLKQEPTKSAAVKEEVKVAKLPPPIKEPPVVDKSISEQTFAELDALKLKKFIFNKPIIVAPPLNSDNPLEGFDSMKMKQSLKHTNPILQQPLSETEPALFENLEFDQLAKKTVDLESQTKDKNAEDILAEIKQRKKLEEILKRKPLPGPSGNSDSGSEKKPAIVQPKYEHIDIEVIAQIDSTAFKSGIRDLSTSLPEGKKGPPQVAKLDAGQSRTSVKSQTGKPNADILSRYVGFIRQKVMSNWKNPLGAEHNQVLVTFFLYPGGNVGQPFIEKSSGNSQLDALALRAIANSAPFPKFPSEFKQSNLHISIHFKYVYLQD